MIYNDSQLRQLFQQKFNIADWTDLLLKFFKVTNLRKTPEPVESSNGEGYYFGKLTTDDNYEIGFFHYIINEGSVAHQRVGLRNLVKQFIHPDYGQLTAALVVFEDGEHWRLSFVCDILGDKTAPKRFTFLFGDSENLYRTPVERFAELQTKGITFANLKEAFSVEALTKEFYNELFKWYEWAVKPEAGVTFPNDVRTDTDDRDEISTKMIRLITRIMFVWFIKQKNLVPNCIFDEDFLKNILKDFDPQSAKNGNYYNAILQNLFFATLNRAIQDEEGNTRDFAKLQGQRDIKTLYRYAEMFAISEAEVIELFAQVPFLNGGLFECLDKTNKLDGIEYNFDGFSRNDRTFADGRPKYRAVVPNILFFEPEKGLFSILNRYNFTVEENTPTEQQVALDPELLGKVFENLLGVYNPETKETARNQSGSFYTPREIVNYMVDESLIAYLGDTPLVRELFADDFDYNPTKWQEYQGIAYKLKTIKILDPACGSGAFPMGVLNRIVEILQKLDTDESSYKLKLNLIENCIYGIDIQSIAMQISKLRFFISLICDCQKDESKPNFGIPTLPNLETKFVCANSLIKAEFRKFQFDKELFNEENSEFTHIASLKNELLDIREKHFKASNHQMKQELRTKDRNKRKEIVQYFLHKAKPDEQKIQMQKAQIAQSEADLKRYAEAHWETTTELELFGETKTKRIDKNQEFRDKAQKNILQCQAEIEKEQKKQVPQGFAAALKQLADWNPYDQNACSPFFDPEWMFNVNEGFDIVIGNPPYGANMSMQDKIQCKNNYKPQKR